MLGLDLSCCCTPSGCCAELCVERCCSASAGGLVAWPSRLVLTCLAYLSLFAAALAALQLLLPSLLVVMDFPDNFMAASRAMRCCEPPQKIYYGQDSWSSVEATSSGESINSIPFSLMDINSCD